MSRVNVTQAHNKPIEEVRNIIHDVADMLSSNYGLKSSWQGEDCVHFRRGGVGGELHIFEDEVTVNLNLGILLGGYAGRIKKELQREMADRLA